MACRATDVPNEPRVAATGSHGPSKASAPFGCSPAVSSVSHFFLVVATYQPHCDAVLLNADRGLT